jgi:predicted transposase YbfD/YdcC
MAVVISERRIGDETSRTERYYISSLSGDATQVADAVRAHWRIENQLHWVLDVSFGNDHTRVRTGHAPENLTVLQHIAINLVKREKTCKRSVNGKRLKAGWDTAYLAKVLNAA